MSTRCDVISAAPGFVPCAPLRGLSGSRLHARGAHTCAARPAAFEKRPRRGAAVRASLDAARAARPLVFFCDVDGTLLSSDNTILPANVDAVLRLPYPDLKFIPATGRSRAGALACFGKLASELKTRYPGGVPGVYLQGLVVYGEDGKLIHEQTLGPSVSRKVVDISRELGVSLIAYAHDGDRILCETANPEVLKVKQYHEPAPEEIGKWENVIDDISIHKFIFMAPEEQILEIRPAVKAGMGNDAEITRATEGMLEILPQGASKGSGVERLQKILNITPEQSLAIGDGENDVEMLELCGISVAMGNAVPAAAEAAKFRTVSNNEGGVAAALERFVFCTV